MWSNNHMARLEFYQVRAKMSDALHLWFRERPMIAWIRPW